MNPSRIILSVAIFLAAFAFSSCRPAPGERPEMEMASFWIRQLPDPDRVLLNDRQIQELNAKIRETQSDVVDVLAQKPIVSEEELVAEFSETIDRFKTKKYFDHTQRPLTEAFYAKVWEEMLPDVAGGQSRVQWALVVRRTSLRALPTFEVALQKPDDLAFDQLQNTALEPCQPLAVLSTNRSRSWLFVQSVFSRGWVPAVDVALAKNQNMLRRYLEQRSFDVVTAPSLTVFGDRTFMHVTAEMGMGNRLYGLRRRNHWWEVSIPQRKADGSLQFETGYLPEGSDVHEGFLPLTQGKVLEQAFKMLGSPYGWGGSWQADDCSGLLVRIFNCFGIVLPRNSFQQAQVGHVLARWDNGPSSVSKEAILDRALPAVSFLQLNGHIMLYLGKAEGRYWVIHTTWNYRRPGLFRDRVVPVGATVVSDLNIGAWTRKGSYLQRLVGVNTLVENL